MKTPVKRDQTTEKDTLQNCSQTSVRLSALPQPMLCFPFARTATASKIIFGSQSEFYAH